MESSETFVIWLRELGVTPRVGASGVGIREAEQRVGCPVPEQLRDLLQRVDGMNEAQWDLLPNLFRLWSAEELESARANGADGIEGIVFGDYSLGAGLFVIDEAGQVLLVGAGSALVSRSLFGFPDAMRIAPDSILEAS